MVRESSILPKTKVSNSVGIVVNIPIDNINIFINNNLLSANLRQLSFFTLTNSDRFLLHHKYTFSIFIIRDVVNYIKKLIKFEYINNKKKLKLWDLLSIFRLVCSIYLDPPNKEKICKNTLMLSA